MLFFDGKCKLFDVSGDGYCCFEVVVVIYLIKGLEVKRIYDYEIGL